MNFTVDEDFENENTVATENEKEKINKDMSEEDIITALLNSNADDKPKMIVPLKRLGIPVTLKALTGKQVFKVRERNTRTIERRNKTEKVLDTEGFNTGLIVAATVKPNWGAPELLNKFRASSGEEVLKRILLGGEISLLGDVVLEISGYNIGIDDIKKLIKSGNNILSVVHALSIRRNILPSEFFNMSFMERKFLIASIEVELEVEKEKIKEMENENGR